MANEADITNRAVLKSILQRWFLDISMGFLFVGMVVWIVCILLSSIASKPSWLLVPITVIYAELTLYMAAAAFKNATAARRSAEAMEASVVEQRLSRFAAFGAEVSFPDGQRYKRESDGGCSIVLGNLYRQPIIGLQVVLWQMDSASASGGQIKYSSMVESKPQDIDQSVKTITVRLSPSSRPEAERVPFADAALERYKDVFKGSVPKSTLCLIALSHRASIGTSYFVYDVNEEDA